MGQFTGVDDREFRILCDERGVSEAMPKLFPVEEVGVSDDAEEATRAEDTVGGLKHLPGHEVTDGISLMEGRITEDQVERFVRAVFDAVRPEKGSVTRRAGEAPAEVFFRAQYGHLGLIRKRDFRLGTPEFGSDADRTVPASQIEDRFKIVLRKV